METKSSEDFKVNVGDMFINVATKTIYTITSIYKSTFTYKYKLKNEPENSFDVVTNAVVAYLIMDIKHKKVIPYNKSTKVLYGN